MRCAILGLVCGDGFAPLPQVLGEAVQQKHGHAAARLGRLHAQPWEVDEAVLRDLLRKRNHYILAHGLKPIEAKSTVRLPEYVDALVEASEAKVGPSMHA